MRILLTTEGSRGDVFPMLALAEVCAAEGHSVRVCAPPDCAAAEGCDALAAIGVVPAGVWR